MVIGEWMNFFLYVWPTCSNSLREQKMLTKINKAQVYYERNSCYEMERNERNDWVPQDIGHPDSWHVSILINLSVLICSDQLNYISLSFFHIQSENKCVPYLLWNTVICCPLTDNQNPISKLLPGYYFILVEIILYIKPLISSHCNLAAENTLSLYIILKSFHVKLWPGCLAVYRISGRLITSIPLLTKIGRHRQSKSWPCWLCHYFTR